MAAHRQQVHSQLFGGEGELQEALDRVAVEQGAAAGPADGLGGLPDGQNGAQLVVHQHHGHQGGVRPDGLLHLPGGYVPLPVRLEIGNLTALPLQGPAGLQDSGVLDGGGDDVAAHPAVQSQGGPDGPVVALSAAGGEEELAGGAAQGAGHVGPPERQGLGGLPAELVHRGGVAPPPGHGFQGGLGGLGTHRGGGGGIKIVEHRQDLQWLLMDSTPILCRPGGKVKDKQGKKPRESAASPCKKSEGPV